MQDVVVDFYKATNVIDIVYLIITIFTLIGCYRRGFVLSILSMAKWFLAYIITLIIFPRAKPYLKGIIDNEYVLDVILGVTIFVIVIFLILMINRGIRKAVRFTGLGSIDTMFGFFFGFIKIYTDNLFWYFYWTSNVISYGLSFNVASFFNIINQTVQ